MPVERHAVPYRPTEWAYRSGKTYENPFVEVTLDAVVESDAGSWRVPAFWAGGGEWRVRFAPPACGAYRVRTVCSDESNPDLHDRTASLAATGEPEGERNGLLARGPVRISDDRRHFVHADGTPFAWLGDTWWMGFTDRLRWPDEFEWLAADRVAKGFTVVQIVAGLFPDMDYGDPRGRNEAGLPWAEDFSTINPAWFDLADLKVQHLVRVGLLPCIVGCWGYYLLKLGPEAMKRHWRYLIARWGAYPVVWCLAGEAAMPYYVPGGEDRDAAIASQKSGWAELGRYVQQTDPFDRPVTIHPTNIGRDQVDDDSVLDFDMLQCGHNGQQCIGHVALFTRDEHRREPSMPVVIGEVTYEGIWHGTGAETQRACFWIAMLSGAAGFTYGGNGIWQLNRPGEPYGPSPHGGTWGGEPWPDVARYPGSRQVGICLSLLRRFEWHRFEPRQDWIAPAGDEGDWLDGYAAGIPGEVRVIYLWKPIIPWGDRDAVQVTALEPGVAYDAAWLDPRTGAEHPIGPAVGDEQGRWAVPLQPEISDWVLVLQRAGD